MKLPSTFIAVCTAATFTAIGASAHDQQSSQQSAGSAQQSSGNQNSAWQKAQAQEFFRSSDIVGKDAQTSNGQKLGSIKDVVFNQQGEIFALVDIGKSRLAVVPWQSVSPRSAKGSGNLTLNTTQNALESGPVVSKDQWGALNNPNFTKGVYSYYHMQEPSTAIGGASAAGGSIQGQGQSQGSSQEQQNKESNQQPSQNQP